MALKDVILKICHAHKVLNIRAMLSANIIKFIIKIQIESNFSQILRTNYNTIFFGKFQTIETALVSKNKKNKRRIIAKK